MGGQQPETDDLAAEVRALRTEVARLNSHRLDNLSINNRLSVLKNGQIKTLGLAKTRL